MANFNLTATSLFEMWTPSVELHQYQSLSQRIFFPYRMVLFLSSLGLFFFLFFSLLLRTKKSLWNLIYAQMIVFCR